MYKLALLDNKVLIIVAVVLAVLIVLSIIKKAVKTVFVLAAVLCLGVGVYTFTTNTLEEAHIKIESGTIYTMDAAIPIDEIRGVSVGLLGESQAEVSIKLVDGSVEKVRMPIQGADAFLKIGKALGADTIERKVQ